MGFKAARLSALGLLWLVLAHLASACVTLPQSTSPYNRLIAQDCSGNATLGSRHRCEGGHWVEITQQSTPSPNGQVAKRLDRTAPVPK